MTRRIGTRTLALGIGLIAMFSSAAAADILYDTMWLVDQAQYNSMTGTSTIGGAGLGGPNYDVQLADDFNVSGPGYAIDRVEGGLGGWDPAYPGVNQTPQGGVWVQFFADVGGHPAEAMFADYLATGSELTFTPFADHSYPEGISGLRIVADISASGISLPAGTWWLSLQPVDTTPTSNAYQWALASWFTDGARPHDRDGGVDHGNGYEGFYGHNDWEVSSWVGPGTLAFRVDGTPVPEPASALLLALAALPLLRRMRRTVAPKL